MYYFLIKMLELLSTILFYPTLIIDLLSTVALCAFTALIFTKVEVSAALEEKCDTCKTHLFYMKFISVTVTVIFAVNFAFNAFKKYIMKYRYMLFFKMICFPISLGVIFNLLAYYRKDNTGVIPLLLYLSIAITSVLFISFILETVYISILTEVESKKRTKKFGLISLDESEEAYNKQ